MKKYERDRWRNLYTAVRSLFLNRMLTYKERERVQKRLLTAFNKAHPKENYPIGG